MEIKISEMALKIIAGAVTTIVLAMINSKRTQSLNDLDNGFDEL